MRVIIAAVLLCYVSACASAPSPTSFVSSPTPAEASQLVSPQPKATATSEPQPTVTEALEVTNTPTADEFGYKLTALCNSQVPVLASKFSLDGQLLLWEHAPNSGLASPEQFRLWSVSRDSESPRSIGAIQLTPQNFSGRFRLSPDGNWILATGTWNPVENEKPIDPIVIASDLSRTLSLRWHSDWDVIEGWWDNTTVIVLPLNGRTSDILALDILTQSTRTLEVVRSAINRTYGRTFWSPWRERDGKVVFFNHAFTQVLFFDQTGTLSLGNLDDKASLWSYNRPDAFFSNNQSIAFWSPDDKFVAFPAWTGRYQELYILSEKGIASKVTSFADSGMTDSFTTIRGWSPDGERLAFSTRTTSSTSNNIEQLYVLDLRERELQKLCMEMSGGQLAWSPDGKYLAVPFFEPDSAAQAISIIDVATGEKWRISTGTPSLEIIGWAPSSGQPNP